MNDKVNPFQPNSPSSQGMFVGRLPEIEVIERALFQTKSDRGQSFLLLGERGIGKTSLMRLVKYYAQGDIPCRDQHLNFLVIETEITKETTQSTLIRKIEIGMRRRLAEGEQARVAFQKIWEFAKRIEAAGVSIKEQSEADKEIIFEEFSYSLADTLKRIAKDEQATLFSARYDGILLLIDEADNASEKLDLGTFVKLLLERLHKEGVNRLMFGIAGLPKTKDVLHASHPSSLRNMEELNLGQLSKDEVRRVIRMALTKSLELNGTPTTITAEAEEQLIHYAEGFPHFIQQYGFSAFDRSDGNVISEEDIHRGAFGETGALEAIGNKYYRQDFYNRINVDSYREVLKIMAKSMDGWVEKPSLTAQFSGKPAILNNAINALHKRNIIIKKDGVSGVYRLRDKGFARWIILSSMGEDAPF